MEFNSDIIKSCHIIVVKKQKYYKDKLFTFIMVNQSKAIDPRFWGTWWQSGAVGGADKQIPSIYQEIKFYKRSGNLTREEISTLIDYQLGNLDTVEKEVKRYYLLRKNEEQKFARNMLDQVTSILNSQINLENIKDLCSIIDRYFQGYIIHYQGKVYFSEGGKVYHK